MHDASVVHASFTPHVRLRLHIAWQLQDDFGQPVSLPDDAAAKQWADTLGAALANYANRAFQIDTARVQDADESGGIPCTVRLSVRKSPVERTDVVRNEQGFVVSLLKREVFDDS